MKVSTQSKKPLQIQININTVFVNFKLLQTLNMGLPVVTSSYLSKIYQITYFNPLKNIFGKLNLFTFLLLCYTLLFVMSVSLKTG